MKAVLPYDAPPSVRRLLAGVEAKHLRIVRLDETDKAGLARELADAEILLHTLVPVTKEVMALGPKLRLVQKIGIGVDTIDRVEAKRRDIAVCNMPGTNTDAVAEHVVALMLACLRRIVPVDSDLRGGRGWTAAEDNLDAAAEIGGAVVGLVGYGAIAQRLTPILCAFGATVIAHARRSLPAGIESVTLDELLARADIVSLHVPLTDETRNLLDAAKLARTKPGAIVINTARGPLIDEAALAAALREGRLGGAGLDVFAREPTEKDNPLFGLRNVVVSPHLAWMTSGTWRRSLGVILENARRLGTGEKLLNRVT
jgi:phosphoglycerate dehydrogenase-like enzyme